VVIAIVSAAAISVGSVGYISAFIDLPQPVLAAGVVIGMATIAAWGIRESVTFAGVMTLIEVGGLVMVIAAGIFLGTNEAGSAPSLPAPPFEPHLIVGILSASLLAVFAFIGFEGLVNVAEELRDPKRNLPRAIFITLALTTLLYVLVVWVSLRAVPPEELGAASAPLALVFERITGLSSKTMSVIAVVATLNGIIVQIIMSSRVLYGLARQGNLPSAFQDVNSVTRTPLTATIFTSVLVLALAVSLPLDQLAEMTSRVTLVLFALMNVALIRIKLREPAAPANGYVAPLWVPWAGVTTCLALLGVDLIFVLAR
jgi:amino acid transporter